ncbi:DUF2569 family protein [Proteiniclasticum sp. C24MP]|uniref:DUF2569 family protein n=1 Tax=Proteiniclasticum sp. C24MP TaxID=3374101 RepID=UPI0037551BDD
MDIIKWIFFMGLGTFIGSFGVVQLLILVLYSLPTNKALNEKGFVTNVQEMEKSDRSSILLLSLITLTISFLVFNYTSSNNLTIYISAILLMVFVGRKQLKGNNDNISDYLRSHQRYFVDISMLDEKETNNLISILQGHYSTQKQGVGGFLLLYICAIAYYSYRALTSIFDLMRWLSNSELITYMVETDSKLIPFSVLQIIAAIGIISFGIYVVYSIYKRKRTIKNIVRNYHILLITVSVVTLFMASLIPSILQEEMIYVIFIEVVITIFFAVWGIQFFSNSIRVGFTFGFNNLKLNRDSVDDQNDLKGQIEFQIKNSISISNQISNAEIEKKKAKRRELIGKRLSQFTAVLLVGVCILALVIWFSVNYTAFGKYMNANALYQLGRYDEACTVYEQLGDYRDAKENIKIVKYGMAVDEYTLGNLMKSHKLFQSIEGYRDSKSYIDNIKPYLRHAGFSLEGRFSSNGKYFEYIEQGDNVEVNSNIPSFDGEYFQLTDFGTIMQFGKDDSYSDSYKFFFVNEDILYVTSLKNGATYKLHREK